MARKGKGRAVSGWLVVDKPAGITSTAVVGKVRWALDAQKAGHAGTLDPAATGVLAIALGEATKTVPFVTNATKGYDFTVRWGAATDTDDAEGQVIATSPLRPTAAQIEAALGAFRGVIQQVPPQYSAVKVNGERAYDIARSGEAMDLAPRSLQVDSLDLVACPDADTAQLRMVCGAGGYVRSIARDLGAALGCLGHVVSLRRLWAGAFDLGNSVDLATIERLARTPDLDAHLIPLEKALRFLPELPLSPEGAVRLKNGNPGRVLSSRAAPGDTAWASFDGKPVAVGTYIGGELHPSRVFNL
jgi:tRNA pseudouridine55 synthase